VKFDLELTCPLPASQLLHPRHSRDGRCSGVQHARGVYYASFHPTTPTRLDQDDENPFSSPNSSVTRHSLSSVSGEDSSEPSTEEDEPPDLCDGDQTELFRRVVAYFDTTVNAEKNGLSPSASRNALTDVKRASKSVLDVTPIEADLKCSHRLLECCTG